MRVDWIPSHYNYRQKIHSIPGAIRLSIDVIRNSVITCSEINGFYPRKRYFECLGESVLVFIFAFACISGSQPRANQENPNHDERISYFWRLFLARSRPVREDCRKSIW